MIRPHAKTALAAAGILALSGSLSGCSDSDAATGALPTWHNTQVNSVSRTVAAAGVAATTSMKPGGGLETVALDLATGRTLWTHPATMAGRLPGMGVEAPAAVDAGGRAVIASLDPVRPGEETARHHATLVVRDARTGQQKWTRPLHSTFGPQRCGGYICLSEQTARSDARVVMLDPLTGRTVWRLPGISEVEWSDATRVVLLRLAAHPVLEAHELKTGKTLWRLPIEQALGPGVSMSGGWAFGAAGNDLIGYVAPYPDPKTRQTAPFGLFSARLSDGTVNWLRPSVVRVYPSGSPGVAPVVRPVDQQGQYGGFARLDAVSGRVLGQITAAQVPGSGWWLAFPSSMDKLGFLKRGGAGNVYDLGTAREVPVKGERGWSFCVTDPKPLKLTGVAPGFYPVASLCRFDLATGRPVTTSEPPPVWFTGAQDGWRIWRDEKGALHAVKDGSPASPGMYG